LLEKFLGKFVCLTTGETIVLNIEGKPFYFDVKETHPDGHYKCVNLIDTDVEIEIEKAQDEETKK